MLLSADRGTNNDIHVYGDERDISGGESINTQHGGEHKLFGNGVGTT